MGLHCKMRVFAYNRPYTNWMNRYMKVHVHFKFAHVLKFMFQCKLTIWTPHYLTPHWWIYWMQAQCCHEGSPEWKWLTLNAMCCYPWLECHDIKSAVQCSLRLAPMMINHLTSYQWFSSSPMLSLIQCYRRISNTSYKINFSCTN